MEDDRTYYARRAEDEWRAAASAPDAASRRLHLELAEMLELRAREGRPLGDADGAREG